MAAEPRLHAHAPFRKIILGPCWVVQIICELVLIILLAMAMRDVATTIRPSYYGTSGRSGIKVRGAVWIVVLLINALLTIGQIIALYRQHLRAWALAGLSIVQSIPLAIAYILNIVYAARQEGNTGATVGATLINTVFLMSFVLPLIHAILIMRRPAVAYQAMSTPLVPQGKSPQGNPHQSWSTFQSHSTAYSHIQPDHDPDAAVEPYSQLEAHHAPYASRGADADFDRQASYNDDIGNEPSYRVSADEAYDDHGPHELGQQSPPSGQHEQQEGLSRRESYSHTRDVRFDSYVARQASTVSRLSERRGSEAGSIGEISPIISRRPSSGSPLGSNPSSRGKSGSGSGSYLPSFSEQLHDRDEWSLGLGIVSEADAPLRGGDMGEQRAFKDVVGMEAVGSPEFKVGDGDAMRILGDDVHQGRNLGTPRIHVEEPVESDDGRSDAGAETRRLT